MHKLKNTTNTEFFIYTLIAFMLLVCESMLTYALYIDVFTLAHYLVGHIAVSAIAVCVWLWAFTSHKDAKFPATMALLTPSLAIFGIAICFSCQVLYAVYRRNALDFKEWYARLFPEDSETSTNQLYERLILGRDDFSEKTNIIPFMDVMTLGSEAQKRTALEKIVRHFRPEFSPVLLKAVDDPNNAIRVQAATILARLEHGFSQKTSMLVKQCQKKPKDYALKKRLAKHYDAYAHSGFLMDETREKQLRDRAMVLYEECLKCQPEDEEIQFFLSKLYLEDRRLEEAYALLMRIVRSDDSQKHVPSKVIWVAMECLFHMHRFDELKAVANLYFPKLDPDSPKDFDLLEMVKFWGGGISLPEELMEAENG